MSATKKTICRHPVLPERVRSIDRHGFAFVSNRFLRDGFFASLTADELRLYFLLILAGDRRGLSFYHYDAICSLLNLTLDDYLAARNSLIASDLVAYDGTRFQVLSLPSEPKPKPRHFVEPAEDDAYTAGATSEIRRSILGALRLPID